MTEHNKGTEVLKEQKRQRREEDIIKQTRDKKAKINNNQCDQTMNKRSHNK
jgi:hypothetical protein